jgi:hypothetical protein
MSREQRKQEKKKRNPYAKLLSEEEHRPRMIPNKRKKLTPRNYEKEMDNDE